MDSLNKIIDDATQLHQEGRLDESIVLWRKALQEAEFNRLLELRAEIQSQLGALLFEREHTEEAFLTLEEALKYYIDHQIQQKACTTYANLAILHRTNGRIDVALECYQKSLEIARQSSDTVNEASILGSLAGMLYEQGNHTEASKYLEEAIVLHRALGNQTQVARLLSSAAKAHIEWGKLEQARTEIEEALTIAESLHDSNTILILLDTQGLLEITTGNWQAASVTLRNAIVLSRELEYSRMEGTLLCNLGIALMMQGNAEEALEAFSHAAAIHVKIGNRRSEAVAINNYADLLAALDRCEEAYHSYHQALEINRAVHNRFSEAILLDGLGLLAVERGEPDEGIQNYEQAIQILREINANFELSTTLCRAAQVYTVCGRIANAEMLIKEAIELATQFDLEHDRIYLETAQSRLAILHKDNSTALQHFQNAVVLFEQFRIGARNAYGKELKKLQSELRDFGISNKLLTNPSHWAG